MVPSCPVAVISVCTAQGEIRPLRLQLEDEEHQLLRVNILEVLKTREVQHVGVEATIFLCRARVQDRDLTFELKYSIRTHTWRLLGKIY